jgi:hypothetical protein
VSPSIVVLRRADLLAQGWADSDLRRRVRSGALVRVGAGAYVAATAAAGDLLVARGRAALERFDGPVVLSHASAAAVHDLPTWGLPSDRVFLTRAAASGGRRTGLTHVRTAPLPADDVVRVGDAVVTSVARTVTDLARTVGFEVGVVVADAALHVGLVTTAELVDAVAGAAGWPGVGRARRAVAFADARSESVGESRSRVALARVGVPAPQLQHVVRTRSGARLGRVDFVWEERRTIGEFDGLVKYRREREDDEDPGDVVTAEKLREDALRTEGYEVVRWVWSELYRFEQVRRRLEQAFARAARRR